MTLFNLLFTGGAIMAVVYFSLAVAAYGHRIKSNDSGIVADARRLSAFVGLWPLYSDYYEPGAKPYRIAGGIVMVLAIAAYVGAFVVGADR